MPHFHTADGIDLTYRTWGSGPPLLCVPGGPMRNADYLGDLGGLGAHRTLHVLDLPGTGGSAAPVDPTSYRCDRLVDVVESWRQHLGFERVDLLGHSAGGNLAVRYAERHGQRLDRLVLVAPGSAAVGLEVSDAVWEETALTRRNEPWYPPVADTIQAILAGEDGPEHWSRLTPFFYGRWDDAARAHADAEDGQRNAEAAAAFRAEGAFDPDTTREALRGFDHPVLVLAGGVDLISPPPTMAAYAGLFPDARLVVQAGAGHYPWLDDADAFVGTLTDFLG